MRRSNGWNVFSLALFALLLAGPAGARKKPRLQAIDNFQVVNDSLFRGGRPDIVGLRFLKELGVKTILNLENKEKYVDSEIRQAAALGIRVISVPMSVYEKPKDRVVNHALEIIDDRSLRPLFVHCHEGMDRTGLIVALERVELEGWKPQEAYQEMLNYGFHKIFFWMKSYYKKRVGLR